GIGRYVCQLQRLTIKFCKSHGSSRSARDFIEQHLLEFTRSNPGIVVYLKPRRLKAPLIVGTFLNGNEQKIPISDKSVEEICQWVEHLKNISGSSEHRLVKTWRTDTPSIQGVWTPYLNKNPKHNITDFPSDSPEFKHQPTEKSASQNLLERADQLRRLKA
ncbi:hypothetical protein HELRODRAFT_72412, partial [Helobdella robusta]|uniref:Large ribosomal subunit protein mL43 n=1 Tax=Helobdella robusta TaxID=6412 RepID=T1G0Z6_HELRO